MALPGSRGQETPEQAGAVLDTFECGLGDTDQMIQAERSQVGQDTGLQISPDPFGRVEFGLVEDTQMQQIALMNDEARFGQVADDRLDDIVAENAERNTEFMKLYFDNTEFQKAIKEAARKRAYRIITEPARDEALARLRAEMLRETTGSGPAGID